MASNDIYMDIDALPADNIETLAARLESRAASPVFAHMRDAYFDALDLPDTANILELGGGTGIVGRAYAKRPDFRGTYTVSDLSQNLIEFARSKALEDGLSDKMDFIKADAMTGDGLEGRQFDAVILHTLISHVPDPGQTLATAKAATKPGGQIAVFDADYASLEIVSGDDTLDIEIGGIRKQNGAHQSKVMRTVPGIAQDLGLEQVHFFSKLLAEAGESEFFIGLARASCGVIMNQGKLSREKGEAWLAAIEQSSDNKRFFGMCPYFTFIYRNP